MKKTRTAQTRVSKYRSTGTIETRYETEYRFAKREFGGWHIVLTDESAIRTVETDSIVEPVATTNGHIGWVVRDDDGWTAFHSLSGEFTGTNLGSGYSTREDAVEGLAYELLSRHLVSPASDDMTLIARDAIDHNELILTASRTVDEFDYEIRYNEIVAARNGR